MQNKQHKQAGFTLIEIIAVLIILGILAAVATPKFMNMQKQARYSTLKSLKASMMSAGVMCYAQASMKGEAGKASKADFSIEGKTISISFGYPTSLSDFAEIMEVGGEFDKTTFGVKGYDGCKITYTAPTAAGESPKYEIPGDESNC